MIHLRFAFWAPMLALSLLPSSDPSRVRLANIAVSGCEQLNRGAICELKPGHSLSVWHASATQMLVYAADARAWQSVPSEATGGGSLFRIATRTGQRSLRMRFVTDPREEQLLQLRAAASWPWQAQIEAADNVAARERLTAYLPKVSGDERAFVLYELARREYRTAQRAAGAQHLREAAALAEQLGRISLARSCYGLLANHASAAHDFVASRAAIAAAQRLPAAASGVTDAYGEALLGNAQGVVAAELAALPAAAAAYEQAQVWVQRGAAELRGHVVNGLAMVSVLQGRLLRAHELYSSLLRSEPARSDICFAAIAVGNLGWVELELLRAGAASATTSADATRHLAAAVEHFARCRATASWRPAHAQLSVAYDALRRGALTAARAGIERAGHFEDEPRMAQYRALLEADLALAEGDAAGAAERFKALHEELRQTLSTEPAWRALEGLGRALAAQGRWPEAIERLEAAERLLAQAARGVPDPSALTSFFGTHDHSARGLRAALLAVGKTGQAFGALRRAERRHLLALARDQRLWERATSEAWQEAYAALLKQQSELSEAERHARLAPDAERDLAQRASSDLRAKLEHAQTRLLDLVGRDALSEDDRLREPRSGELMIAWLRSERGSEAYATFGEETRHIEYARPPESREYLDPFADWLAQAQEVSVLSFSQPQRLDVHQLPYRDSTLIAHLPVSYALDLPPRAANDSTQAKLALLATDRRSDLVHAQRELDGLKSALQTHAWSSTELTSRQDLLTNQARARLFYYAGHARADSTGALRSALAFGDGELSVADILALRIAPAQVVLSACDAARAPDLREAVGISLGEAFVLAGSDAVLAPARPIDDRSAERFASLVRDGLARGDALATLYRRAVLDTDGGLPFRYIVP